MGMAVVVGTLIALITQQIRVLITMAATNLVSGEANAALIDAGMRGGITFCVLLVAIFGIPALWRSNSHPRVLRMLALTGIQVPAIAVGLLIPDALTSAIATAVVAAWGTIWWVVWSARWQGTGVAPSLLTGVLRPHIHPGQIWFAFVTGHQVSKIRPVLVMEPASNGSWTVLYFTSQEPKAHLRSKYLAIEEGAMRGVSGQNFIEVVDIRHIKTKHFKKYVGLSPRWVYDSARRHSGLVGSVDALLVDEIRAGEHMGPFERAAFDAMFRSTRGKHRNENAFLTDGLRRFMSMTITDKDKK